MVTIFQEYLYFGSHGLNPRYVGFVMLIGTRSQRVMAALNSEFPVYSQALYPSPVSKEFMRVPCHHHPLLSKPSSSHYRLHHPARSLLALAPQPERSSVFLYLARSVLSRTM